MTPDQRARMNLKRRRLALARRAAQAKQQEIRNRPIKRMMREHEARRVAILIAEHRRAKATAVLEKKHGHHEGG